MSLNIDYFKKASTAHLFKNNHPVFLAIVVLISVLLFIAFILHSSNNKILSSSRHIYFGEFVQSTNFDQLIDDNTHAFNYRINGGTYNLGIPIAPNNESVYGTNRGSRTIPLLVFANTLQSIFGNYWDRIYLLIILSLPYIVFLASVTYFKVKEINSISLIAALVFAFNPWIFSRLGTGFWQLHIAYAFIPFIFFSFIYLLKTNAHLKLTTQAILTVFAISIVYSFQPHFLVMLAMPLSCYYLYRFLNNNQRINRSLVIGKLGLILILFLVVNAYHIFPSLLHKPFTITVQGQHFSLAAVSFNGQGSRLIDVFKLSAVGPLEAKDYHLELFDYLKYGFILSSIIFSIFGFIHHVILKSNDNFIRKSLFLYGFLFIFIFLAKGVNPPFENFSIYIYKNVSFMSIFRDPSRFYSVIAFFASLIILKVNVNIKTPSLRYGLYSLWYVWFFIVVYFMSSSFAEKIQYTSLPNDRYNKFTELSFNTDRTLLLPDNVKMNTFRWFDDELTSGHNTSPITALIPSSFNLGNFSGYADSYFSQLNIFMQEKLVSKLNISHLITRMNIKNILIDHKLKNDYPDKDLVDSLSNVVKENDFSKTRETDGITLHTNNSQTEFFSNLQPIFIVGDLNTFNSLSEILPTQNPIILLNQKVNIVEFVSKTIKNQTIVYRNKDELTNLFLNGLDLYSIHPEKAVWHHETNWNLFEPYIRQKVKTGIFFNSGRSIVGNKPNSTFSLSHEAEPGKYVLLIHSLIKPDGSNIQIEVNDKTYIFNNTGQTEMFTWKIIDSVDLNHENNIKLNNGNDEYTVIDDILLVPEEVYFKQQNLYKDLLESNNLVALNTFLESQSKGFSDNSNFQTYKKGHAEWKLSSSSKWLTMNFPFDKGWTMNSQKAMFIGNYYGITFLGTDESPKIVTYIPEATFQYAFALSTMSIFILTLLLVFTFARDRVS